ncbi:MAG: hypothetical protein J6386_09465 [Candidatus Synoicihabitans palmerolidicus]|nr:hypothetical protein [Candidatus Synoicihabitans palmerolidicus]
MLSRLQSQMLFLVRWGGLALGIMIGGTGCVSIQSGPPRERIYASMEERAEAHTELGEQAWKMVQKRFYSASYNGADWDTAFERYRERAAVAESTGRALRGNQ